MSSSSTSAAVLVVGYLLAVPFTVFVPGFLRLWRRREPAVVAAAEVGGLLIALGWLLQDALVPAAFNATWTVGLAVALLAEGRKRRRTG